MADPKRRSVFERLQEQQTRRSVFDRLGGSGPEAEMVVGEPEIIKSGGGASGSWDAPEPDEETLMSKFVGGARDTALGVASGGTMGWVDELAGPAREWAGTSARGEGVSDVRRLLEDARARSPWLVGGGEVAGNVAAGMAASPARLGALGAAALTGAASGAGYADEGERWQAAAQGGLAGLATMGAAQGLGATARAAGGLARGTGQTLRSVAQGESWDDFRLRADELGVLKAAPSYAQDLEVAGVLPRYRPQAPIQTANKLERAIEPTDEAIGRQLDVLGGSGARLDLQDTQALLRARAAQFERGNPITGPMESEAAQARRLNRIASRVPLSSASGPAVAPSRVIDMPEPPMPAGPMGGTPPPRVLPDTAARVTPAPMGADPRALPASTALVPPFHPTRALPSSTATIPPAPPRPGQMPRAERRAMARQAYSPQPPEAFDVEPMLPSRGLARVPPAGPSSSTRYGVDNPLTTPAPRASAIAPRPGANAVPMPPPPMPAGPQPQSARVVSRPNEITPSEMWDLKKRYEQEAFKQGKRPAGGTLADAYRLAAEVPRAQVNDAMAAHSPELGAAFAKTTAESSHLKDLYRLSQRQASPSGSGGMSKLGMSNPLRAIPGMAIGTDVATDTVGVGLKLAGRALEGPGNALGALARNRGVASAVGGAYGRGFGGGGEPAGNDGRGQYMGDVVQQSLQQDPQSLGPYAQRFAEAAATRDPMAMASLLEKLDEEEEWRTRYRPALMARTRESR